MKVKNTELLSAGNKIYAKKRKAKKEVVESVEFDPEKRKQKLAARKEAREQRQRLADKNVQEMAAMLRGNMDEPDSFQSEEEEEEEEVKPKENVVKEFKTNSTLTTVTVIEDLDLENE
ncbi:hypothetical protein K501DRAFT_235172 [Backusella circina FSU 941]|nr:hypothetical protein K501DRAFT_235172 [Backusella circina FSU 941]